MRVSAALAAAIAGLAAAAPTQLTPHAGELHKRALSTNDTDVLQLALYLEHLEFALYSGGCDTFSDAQFTASGFPAGFHKNLCQLAEQENIHAMTISGVLQQNGVTPVPACQYSFPYSDPVSFVDLANMITSVGIGAYLGGAQLLDQGVLITTAASILSNEARHDSFLRNGLGGSPFPAPFDTALAGIYAYSAAQMFITQCPMQLSAFVVLPKLEATAPAPQPHLAPMPPPGTTLEFKWDPKTFFVSVDPSKPLYIAIINQNVLTPYFQQVQNLDFYGGTGSVPLPAGVAGAAFAFLTTFSSGLNENQLSSFGTLAGPAELIIS